MRTSPNIRLLLAMVLAGLLANLTACSDGSGVNPAADRNPHEWLSDYRLFTGNQAYLQPNDRVLPYELNSPLFTDYAEKARFVWMHDGATGLYRDTTIYSLPPGTILVKNFHYPGTGPAYKANGYGRLVETRLLVHEQDGWKGYPYIWNREQTDARLSLTGGEQEVTFIGWDGNPRSIRYLVPNANQCRSCHSHNGQMQPIGIATRHLNRDYIYADGTGNQLHRWVEAGYLDRAPDPEVAERMADYRDPATGNLEERVRAMLDINCGHCHMPGGPGGTSGLFLHYHEQNPFAMGVMKPPVAAGRGAGGFRYSIVPGQPDESILLYRMLSVEPGIMMPEYGRTIVDEEAVELLREWINAMAPMGVADPDN
jgi:uncharacterized repeat protein (TIGR03806 family)